MSGSGAIIQGYGTQYDYIRPGISMFGVAGTGECKTKEITLLPPPLSELCLGPRNA